MSTSITTAFVRDYEEDVNHVFQRQGASLRGTVRTEDNVVGKSTTFQKIGKGIATTKSRHGVITPMNQDHTAIECSLSDFYAGDWYDKLDAAKVKHDERMAIATGGAWALGRKVDDQIITALDTTSQGTVNLTVTSEANIRAGALTWVKTLFRNDVPNDGQIFGLITPTLDALFSLVDEYASADYVDSKRFTEGPAVGGRFRQWLGVNWAVHTGLPNEGAASCKGFVYHKLAVGYATGAHSMNKAQDGGHDIAADISWHGDRQSHFIAHCMSGGACLIDDTGVIEASWDDSSAIPTS